MEDHNSQFHVLWPQKNKEDDEVADNLESRWFGPYGLPKILQTDNGLESQNKNC